jgi:hypothetical protein
MWLTCLNVLKLLNRMLRFSFVSSSFPFFFFFLQMVAICIFITGLFLMQVCIAISGVSGTKFLVCTCTYIHFTLIWRVAEFSKWCNTCTVVAHCWLQHSVSSALAASKILKAFSVKEYLLCLHNFCRSQLGSCRF